MAAPAAVAVVVDGPGPLAAEVAHQLRRAGVGVRAGALAADGAGQLVVLVRDRPVPVWASAPWQARAVPQLPVEAGPPTTVGPLVVPGRSPCLACVARRRPPAPPATTGAPPGDPAARILAAAVATVTALALLRGDVRLAGISTEIGPAVETVTHRLWHVDPGCRCASVRMAG